MKTNEVIKVRLFEDNKVVEMTVKSADNNNKAVLKDSEGKLFILNEGVLYNNNEDDDPIGKEYNEVDDWNDLYELLTNELEEMNDDELDQVCRQLSIEGEDVGYDEIVDHVEDLDYDEMLDIYNYVREFNK